MVERPVERAGTSVLFGVQRLPIELVTKILECLSWKELWPVAAVSRTFYAVAWIAGLSIRRRIHWSVYQSRAPPLDIINDIVQHVLRKGLKLDLNILIYPSRLVDDSVQLDIQNILSTVTAALPILVHLCIDMPFGPQLVDALNHPAPQLRGLYLERYWNIPAPQPYPMPPDFLGGLAPQLRTVILHDVVLGKYPVAAFSRVTYATLDLCGRLPDGPLSVHFPRLTSLRLAACDPEHGPPPTGFNLGGLGVHRMCICDSDSFPPVHLGDVSDLERVCHQMDWTEPLWQRASSDTLSVCIQHRAIDELDMSIVVVPLHRRWRRAFHLEQWDCTIVSPLASMPGANERVTRLRIENTFLIGLLEAGKLKLDALCELRVDFPEDAPYPTMIWPPDHTDEMPFSPRGPVSAPTFPAPEEGVCYFISCRNLRTMKLFACDEPVLLDSEAVAFLGHALGQSLRPSIERPVLELIGVDFEEPVAQMLLEDTFSSVLKRGMVRWGSDEHTEGDMWSEWLSEGWP